MCRKWAAVSHIRENHWIMTGLCLWPNRPYKAIRWVKWRWEGYWNLEKVNQGRTSRRRKEASMEKWRSRLSVQHHWPYFTNWFKPFSSWNYWKRHLHIMQNYTCQLFLRYRREIFILGVLRFFEENTIISEDPRWSPKSSEEFRSLPKTSEVPVLV